MFDFTLREEDKDSYIVDVHINDDGTYTVKCASGREETYDFSIHNFQVELYRMEDQFEQFSKGYLERVYPAGKMRTALLGMLLVVDVMTFKNMLEEGFTFSGVWCLAYGMYVLLGRGIPQLKQRKLYVEAKKKLAVLKRYFESREDLKVQVVNPNTNDNEDWYLVDLGNIDQFKSVKEYDKYLSSMTPEKKEEEAQKLSLKFKGFKDNRVTE